MKMLIVLSCVFACSISTGLAQTNAGSTAGLEELMKKVLTALEAKDQSALERLAITEDGYHKYIWPGINATNTPGASEKRFYSMFQRGSAAGIASALKEFGGQKMEFVRISMGTPIRQTKGYRLLRPPSVTVKDVSGQERTLNLTGAIVEHDGGYQVATYFVPAAQQTSSPQANR
jgi:hypothetical protein